MEINIVTIEFAAVPTYKVKTLSNTPEVIKIALVQNHIGHVYAKVISCDDDCKVILKLTKELSASLRGQILLDIEDYLKENLDPGITVWLAPLGDRNSLRHLRGMVMK
jgi:hypothetical protein